MLVCFTIAFKSRKTGCNTWRRLKGKKMPGEVLGGNTCIMNLLDHPAGWFGQIVARFQNLTVTQNDAEKVIEVMGNAAGQLADSLHFLGLAELLFCLLDPLALCDVTDIALDDLFVVHPVDIAHELNVDGPTGASGKRQIFIANIFLRL